MQKTILLIDEYDVPLDYAFLTGTFFVVFGVTFGSCFSFWMYGKKPLFSLFLPVFVSVTTNFLNRWRGCRFLFVI